MQIKIYRLRYVRMNCTSILKSNQACNCTGVSPKCTTKISFSRFIRCRLFPSPANWPALTTALSRCICTKYKPVHRLSLFSVLMSAAYLFCPGQRSNGTNHVCPSAPVMSLPAQVCIAFDSDLSVVMKKRCLGESRSRLGLG